MDDGMDVYEVFLPELHQVGGRLFVPISDLCNIRLRGAYFGENVD